MAERGDTHHKLRLLSADPQDGYLLSGKIMITSIVVLFVAVILMAALHVVGKRYITGLRRRQYERRRDLLVSRSQILMYINSLSAGDQGLEPQVINSLPLYFYTPKPEQLPTECPVCLSEFEYKDVVRLLPKCNHCFHLECIDTWFLSHSTCPICRSSVEMAAGTVIRPVWKFNYVPDQPEPSSGCATCQHEEGSNLDGGTKIEMELVEVRVEMPPWRVAVENEISQHAVANQLSLTRIRGSIGENTTKFLGPNDAAVGIAVANSVTVGSEKETCDRSRAETPA